MIRYNPGITNKTSTNLPQTPQKIFSRNNPRRNCVQLKASTPNPHPSDAYEPNLQLSERYRSKKTTLTQITTLTIQPRTVLLLLDASLNTIEEQLNEQEIKPEKFLESNAA